MMLIKIMFKKVDCYLYRETKCIVITDMFVNDAKGEMEKKNIALRIDNKIKCTKQLINERST
jgi:hypothetical protein